MSTEYVDDYAMNEDEDEYEDEEDGAITSEDCWAVISSFFDTKGLVSQQLDSYDEFTRNTIQDIVKENQLPHRPSACATSTPGARASSRGNSLMPRRLAPIHTPTTPRATAPLCSSTRTRPVCAT